MQRLNPNLVAWKHLSLLFATSPGFKVPGKYFATNEEYDANTIKFEDVFINITSSSDSGIESTNEEAHKVTKMRTVHRGSCYVVTLNHKLQAMATVTMTFKSDAELRFYVAEPGMEKFLIFEIWPNEIPYFGIVKSNMSFYDKAMTKRIARSSGHCHDGNQKDHYICVRNVVKDMFQQKLKPENGCLTPWLSDFLGEPSPKPCSPDQARTEYQFVYELLFQASRGEICKS